MAYVVPTLRDLMQKARNGFRRHMKGTDASIWPNNIYPTAKVIAGSSAEVMGYADYIARGRFAHLAPDIESLALHGEEFGIPQKPAEPASGKVTLSSDGQISVDAGAILRRTDGREFSVVAGGALVSAGDLDLDVVSVLDGQASNTLAGAELVDFSGVTSGTGVSYSFVVSGDGISLGADVESIESWRARILFRKRNPPHGGSASDYVLWASSISGVSVFGDRPDVYVERLYAGPGTVRVFPLMYDLYEDGVPSVADVARVRNYIETVQPSGAKVVIAAPVRKFVNISISGLEPNTTSVREAVMAELRDTFRRRARVAGIDKEIDGMEYLARPAGFSRSWIWQAIANATGEDRHVLLFPDADIELAPGELPVLGEVTFV